MPTLYLQRQLLQFSSLGLLLASTLDIHRDRCDSVELIHHWEFALQVEQQKSSDWDAETYVSSIRVILHVADAYASNF